MDVDILITALTGVLLVVAAVGTVYPVLPGSPIAIAALVVWAVVIGSWPAWVAGGVGALVCLVGWSASAILTGRKLKRLEVPARSVTVAAIAGVIGLFLIPAAGLFIGFAAGLMVAESLRHRDLRHGLRYSLATLKAMGTGVLIEFLLVCLAAAFWSVGVIVHFVTR